MYIQQFFRRNSSACETGNNSCAEILHELSHVCRQHYSCCNVAQRRMITSFLVFLDNASALLFCLSYVEPATLQRRQKQGTTSTLKRKGALSCHRYPRYQCTLAACSCCRCTKRCTKQNVVDIEFRLIVMRSDSELQFFIFRSEKKIGLLMQSDSAKSDGTKSDMRIRWPKSSGFGPKSVDSQIEK